MNGKTDMNAVMQRQNILLNRLAMIGRGTLRPFRDVRDDQGMSF